MSSPVSVTAEPHKIIVDQPDVKGVHSSYVSFNVRCDDPLVDATFGNAGRPTQVLEVPYAGTYTVTRTVDAPDLKRVDRGIEVQVPRPSEYAPEPEPEPAPKKKAAKKASK